jgi:hypothetical protein
LPLTIIISLPFPSVTIISLAQLWLELYSDSLYPSLYI